MTVTVHLPEMLEEALKRRAQQIGKKPEDVIIDIVAKELDSTAAVRPMTEREKVRAALKAGNFLTEVSPELVKRYVTTHSEEERDALLKELQKISLSSPTLSEMIIEDREPH
jgi:hypothetical protein